MSKESHILQQLQCRLAERLRLYEEQYGCRPEGLFTASDPTSIITVVESATTFAWPYSAYDILRAMSWVLSHPQPPEDQWWSELGVLLHVLNVSRECEPGTLERWAERYGEASAARWRQDLHDVAEFWTEEVQKWPAEDWIVIRDWLEVVSRWDFVKECFQFEVESALSFWSGQSRSTEGN